MPGWHLHGLPAVVGGSHDAPRAQEPRHLAGLGLVRAVHYHRRGVRERAARLQHPQYGALAAPARRPCTAPSRVTALPGAPPPGRMRVCRFWAAAWRGTCSEAQSFLVSSSSSIGRMQFRLSEEGLAFAAACRGCSHCMQ